jgi:hypothetical protein
LILSVPLPALKVAGAIYKFTIASLFSLETLRENMLVLLLLLSLF